MLGPKAQPRQRAGTDRRPAGWRGRSLTGEHAGELGRDLCVTWDCPNFPTERQSWGRKINNENRETPSLLDPRPTSTIAVGATSSLHAPVHARATPMLSALCPNRTWLQRHRPAVPELSEAHHWL